MTTSSARPETHKPSPDKPWRRRLIGAALLLGAVTLLVLSLTVLRNQVARHYLELSNHIATVDRAGNDLGQQRQLLEQALQQYSGAVLLRFASAIASSLLALAALVWFYLGARKARRAAAR